MVSLRPASVIQKQRMTGCIVVLLVFCIHLLLTLQMKRVAIVGGGYAGLGSAYQYAKSAASSVIHMYDHLPVGNAEASSVSAGIMHPMATRGKVIWNGLKGMEQSLLIMSHLQNDGSHKNVCNTKIQLNRLLFSDEEVTQWKDAAAVRPDLLEMTSNRKCNAGALGTVVVKQAALVESSAYLKCLWEYILQRCNAAEWRHQRVQSVSELASQYDVVILACGGGIKRLCDKVPLPAKNRITSLRLVRGQNLVFRNPTSASGDDSAPGDGLGNLQHAYLSGEYVLPHSIEGVPAVPWEPSHWLCGPTHEHITTHQYEEWLALPEERRTNVNIAEQQLRGRIARLYPALAGETTLGVTAGTRVVTQRGELGRLPIVGRLPGFSNVWVHTGFGSRGLILHALTSQYLFEAIQSNDDACIPVGLGVLA